MGFQPDVGEPTPDRLPHEAGLAFGHAVGHHVITEPFEPDGREVPAHPGVEGVVHEQVGDQRRYHAPNAKGNFCFEATLGYRRLERGR